MAIAVVLAAMWMIAATTPTGAAAGVAGARGDVAVELSLPVAVELSLPFEGVWGVVQGFDSGDTHTGYAAFALDFAPPQDVGQFARLTHPRLTDFACYGRPVVAPADGTVVRIATDRPDLAPYAKPNPKPNAKPRRKAAARSESNGAGSGNFVIIQHAPALYTELVHLKSGSVRVVVGQVVRRGQPVGACGNSGNARTPHLHLGLLTSITPITTGRMKLAHYEVLVPEPGPRGGKDARWTPGDGEPKQGQWIRPAAATTQSSGR